jgi:hypothetical protein
MKEIMVSIIVLFIIRGIAQFILPRIKWLFKRFINLLVAIAEKRVKGSSMGSLKKAKILKWLGWIGIHGNKFVDELIESAVEVMNSKGVDVSSSIQSDVADKVVDKIETTTKKVIK